MPQVIKFRHGRFRSWWEIFCREQILETIFCHIIVDTANILVKHIVVIVALKFMNCLIQLITYAYKKEIECTVQSSVTEKH